MIKNTTNFKNASPGFASLENLGRQTHGLVFSTLLDKYSFCESDASSIILRCLNAAEVMFLLSFLWLQKCHLDVKIIFFFWSENTLDWYMSSLALRSSKNLQRNLHGRCSLGLLYEDPCITTTNQRLRTPWGSVLSKPL